MGYVEGVNFKVLGIRSRMERVSQKRCPSFRGVTGICRV